MNGDKRTGWLVLTGSLAVVLGLIYLGNAPGLTGAVLEDMMSWANWSIGAGVMVILGAVALRTGWRWVMWAAALAVAVTFIIQVLPVGLWVAPGSDAAKEGPLAGKPGNWLWAVPHVIVALLATIEGRRLLRDDD